MKQVLDYLYEHKNIIKECENTKYYSFSGLFVEIMDILDELFVKLAVNEYEADKEFYPMILPVSEVNRFNYFSKLPSVPYLCGEINNEGINLQKLANDAKENIIDHQYFDKKPIKVYWGSILNPSVCYHTFLSRKNSVLSDSIKVVTAKNQCARNEKNDNNPFRITQFTMRECVFIGEKNIVENHAIEFFDKFCSYIRELIQPINVEYSNDMFFGLNHQYLSRFQQSMKLKKELKIEVFDENNEKIMLSCLSHNLHKTHLVNAFNISSDKYEAESACVAVGLERLTYALLCHCGLDIENWPESKIKEMLIKRKNFE